MGRQPGGKALPQTSALLLGATPELTRHQEPRLPDPVLNLQQTVPYCLLTGARHRVTRQIKTTFKGKRLPSTAEHAELMVVSKEISLLNDAFAPAGARTG